MTDPVQRKLALVIGGSGFIGRHLIRDLIARQCFDAIYNLDIRTPASCMGGENYLPCDVRKPFSFDLGNLNLEETWIFNLAAACREPGFTPQEYFDINVNGAESVTAFAASNGIRNIFFTSTMSSYGRMLHPTSEDSPQYPETPYGVSKTIAERIHRTWLAEDKGRRLIICRPSVIFGPGDKENIPRMIRAVRTGYFIFPGSPDIVKGYGYVLGLIDSVHFVISGNENRLTIYNYAEKDCLSLGGMVNTMSKFLGKKPFVFRVPMTFLVLTSYLFVLLSKLTGKKYSIHPVRVRKVGFPTNLKPTYLINSGFQFKYPLDKALEHWKSVAPTEF